MVRHLRSTGRPAVCAPVVNRDVNQLELGRRPWSSPTLDLGRRSRVEECEVNPESGDYGYDDDFKRRGVFWEEKIALLWRLCL